jgi:hypothetical protein
MPHLVGQNRIEQTDAVKEVRRKRRRNEIVDANPEALTVATAGLLDVQVARAVKSLVVESEYVPVAANCCVLPAAMDGLPGVTAIASSCGGWATVSVVEPTTAPELAPIVVVPAPRPVASPVDVIVAVPAADDVHVTELLRS